MLSLSHAPKLPTVRARYSGLRHNGTDGDVTLGNISHNIDSDHPMAKWSMSIHWRISENYLAGSPALYGHLSHGVFPASCAGDRDKHLWSQELIATSSHLIYSRKGKDKDIKERRKKFSSSWVALSTCYSSSIPNADSGTHKHIFRILYYLIVDILSLSKCRALCFCASALLIFGSWPF